MTSLDESPQLGRAHVDRESLAGEGTTLTALAADLGVTVDAGSAADAPSDGWRVLRKERNGSMLLGAPIDSSKSTWRIAQVQNDSEITSARVHADALRLRPSQAARRRGLTLSWPTVMPADGGGFVVDVVNESDTAWAADGDSFYAVGTLAKPGATGVGFSWGMLSQEDAVPLGAGDYARVRVNINAGVWARLEPGTYELHVILIDLGVRTPHPLTVTLSAETIARYAARAHPRGHPPEHTADERRSSLDAQIAHTHTRIAATQSLGALAEAVTTADTDIDAIERISALIECDIATAQMIYHSPLRELRPGNAAELERQLENLTRHRHDS